jgi:hypothetical protein
VTDLSPEDSAKLKELSQALRSEFQVTATSDYRKEALTDLADLKQEMLTSLRSVLRHSQSEHLRAKVAMWGYEKLLEQDKATRDPLIELMQQIPSRRNVASDS